MHYIFCICCERLLAILAMAMYNILHRILYACTNFVSKHASTQHCLSLCSTVHYTIRFVLTKAKKEAMSILKKRICVSEVNNFFHTPPCSYRFLSTYVITWACMNKIFISKIRLLFVIVIFSVIYDNNGTWHALPLLSLIIFIDVTRRWVSLNQVR